VLAWGLVIGRTSIEAGSKVDRYEILRPLDEGGTGAVFEAEHEFTRKRVALKVLHMDRAMKAHLVEKMRAEAILLTNLRHEHLLEVFDAGIDEECGIWMAMELLEGQTLKQIIKRGPLAPDRAIDYAIQIARGVAVAHEKAVFHRDLKPENVFVTTSDQIKVIDFGIASFQSLQQKASRKSELIGTVPYMSPEHLAAEVVDGRTDIYSLGLMLWEMLMGRHPFALPDGSFPPMGRMVTIQLAAEPPSLAPQLGEPLWRVIEQAVAKDRAARWRTMDELAAALQQARQQLREPKPVAYTDTLPLDEVLPTTPLRPAKITAAEAAAVKKIAAEAAAAKQTAAKQTAAKQTAAEKIATEAAATNFAAADLAAAEAAATERKRLPPPQPPPREVRPRTLLILMLLTASLSAALVILFMVLGETAPNDGPAAATAAVAAPSREPSATPTAAPPADSPAAPPSTAGPTSPPASAKPAASPETPPQASQPVPAVPPGSTDSNKKSAVSPPPPAARPGGKRQPIFGPPDW